VIQSERDWLDVGMFQDLVFWLDCRKASSSPTLTYETSPRKEDAFFSAMVGAVDLSSAASGGVVVATPVLAATATVPPGRWARWSITSAVDAWSVTFRIYVSGNWVGG
jgi:hypothetical protein